MEGNSFFAGLLRGFGGSWLEQQQQQRREALLGEQQEMEGQKQLFNFLVQGVENQTLDPDYGNVLISRMLTDPEGLFAPRKTRGGRRPARSAATQSVMDALGDPENLAPLLQGAHRAFSGYGGKRQAEPDVMSQWSAGHLVPRPNMAPAQAADQASAQPAAPAPATPWGVRADGTPKGEGFLGALRRPDGGVSSELSIGVDFGQGETEIPTLVPTLTAEDVQTLLNLPDDQPIPKAIADKASAFAQQRLAAGQSPFAGPGEAQLDLFPEFPRGLEPGTAAPATQATFPPLAAVTPRPRLWTTAAQRQQRRLQTQAQETAATTQATLAGRMAAAQQFLETGQAKTMEEAKRLAGFPAPTEAERTLSARSLYETDLANFRQTNGRDPDPTEQRTLMDKALEDHTRLTRIAQDPNAAPALEARAQEILARGGGDPTQATKEQKAQAYIFAAKELEAERQRAESRKGELNANQVVTQSRLLRNDFNRETQAAQTVKTQFLNMKTAFDALKKGARAPGGIALITTFNKILDPYSVVMVSEFARSEYGLALRQQLEGLWTKISQGGLSVPDEVLEQYVNLAEGFAQNQIASAAGIRQEFEDFAKEYGLNVNFVTRPITLYETPAPPQTPNTTTPGGGGTGSQGVVPGLTRDANGNIVTVPR
jgi:hypothetical protein